jgi:hypothetical protein
MHTPGHNPFMTEGGQDYDVNATLQFLEDILLEYQPGSMLPLGDIAQYTASPLYGQQDYMFNLNLPSYQYQGISPDIMGALGNVLNLSGVDDFSAADFGEDFLTNQIQDQLQGLVLDNQLVQGSQEYYDAIDPQSYAEGTSVPMTTDLSQFAFDPTLYQTSEEDLLSSIDFGDAQNALAFTNIFDPESLANTLSQLGSDTLTAAEVKALTPEMLEKTTSEYYSPYEEAERANLVDKLGTATAKVNTGGFAGSGSRTAGLSGAERLYRGGYEDILGDIAKLRGGATTDVLDTIYGWQELMG